MIPSAKGIKSPNRLQAQLQAEEMHFSHLRPFIVLKLFAAQRRATTLLKPKTRGIPAFIVASCVQNILSIMTTTTYTRQR